MSQSLPIHAPCSARFRSASRETRALALYVWARKLRLLLPVWLCYWQLSIKILWKAGGQVCLPAAMLTGPSVCAPVWRTLWKDGEHEDGGQPAASTPVNVTRDSSAEVPCCSVTVGSQRCRVAVTFSDGALVTWRCSNRGRSRIAPTQLSDTIKSVGKHHFVPVGCTKTATVTREEKENERWGSNIGWSQA